jgi:hypothetical protein
MHIIIKLHPKFTELKENNNARTFIVYILKHTIVF